MRLRIMFTLFAMLLFAAVARSQPNADGYTLQASGYYTYGAEPQLYYRSLITVQPRVVNGCYVQGISYYQYVRHTPVQQQAVTVNVQATPAVQVPAYAPNWRQDGLKLIAELDDRRAYGEFIRALGQQYGSQIQNANGGIPGYLPGTVYSGNFYSQTVPVAQGNTVYGASYASLVNALYGGNSVSNDQLAQLASQQQNSADRSIQALHLRADAESASKNKFADILAKGHVADQILKTLLSSGESTLKGYSFRIEPATGVIRKDDSNVPPDTKAKNLADLAALVGDKCASCHAKGGDAKLFTPIFGTDISHWPEFTPEQKQAVVGRLVTSDPLKLMPRGPDGKGVRLPNDKVQLFMVN